MKKHPLKPKKKKKESSLPERFDKSKLTDEDWDLLKQFQERRQHYNDFLKTSNVLFYQKTCAACGYPTLKENEAYETCIICLWEDHGQDDKNDHLILVPNYISLVEHRLNVQNMLQPFLKEFEVDDESCVRNIIAFKKALYEKKVALDTVNFHLNIKKILVP